MGLNGNCRTNQTVVAVAVIIVVVVVAQCVADMSGQVGGGKHKSNRIAGREKSVQID